ncbi:unnamed protein product (macronuclear) [Paramecium tetraurelia]|uniref:Tetraspanin family protein n=1 Tax=Paramecium tetraurelia TaxID=5888 RepID=A0BI38_PARTE|nr:uncharacterized protein GSPATT00029241001 [Paramecium tetraurelia]CAK58205.1 unnamed protein product [Paramecium tetraurelia]|eukprot:XP_001425603.1 hypothetical protein (macronuclear) [Paramecium tetraurelia strain d4-2]
MELQIGSDGLICGRCIPFKTLKIIVLSGSGLILTMCLIIEILVYINKGKVNDADTGDYSSTAASSTLFFFNVQMYMGIVGGISTLFGIGGILNNNKCLLGCFNTFNCCLFWVFGLVYLIVSFFSKISDFTKLSGCSLSYDLEREALYKKASLSLCQDNCECYFSGTVSKDQSKYVINFSPTDTTMAVNFQQCPQSFDSNQLIMSQLKQSETFYECSGWCTKYPIQLFNNVNSKISSSNACKTTIEDYWNKFRQILQYTSFLIAFFFVLMFGFTCIYCFYPKGDPKNDENTKIRLINQ